MVTRYIKDAFIYGAGDSIVGQVRKANEDNCGYRKTVNGELFVVCDGMGGHVGGATASRIAVNSITDYISQHASEDKRVVLKDSLLFANMQILGAAAQDPTLKGMGTTACIALVDGQNIWIAHVGDSRIYLYSENEKYLYRITKDHSLVQGLVDRGELDDRDAEHHPQKNIILRALGTKPELEPEVDQAPIKTQVGDTLLICSDGLCGMINDDEIEAILKKDALSLEDKVQTLIDAANAPGKGKDNITAQLIQILSSMDNISSHPNYNPKWRRKNVTATPPSGDPVNPPTPDAINWKKIFTIVGAIVACLLMLFIALFFFNNSDNTDNMKPVEKEIIAPAPQVPNENAETANAEAEKAKAQTAEAEAKKAEAEAKKAEAEAKKVEAEAKKAEAEAKKADAEAKRVAEENEKSRLQAEAKKAAESEAAKKAVEVEATKKAEEANKAVETKVEPVPTNNEPKPAKVVTKECSVAKNGHRKFTEPEVLGLKTEESQSIEWISSDPKTVKIEPFGEKGFQGLKKGKATISGKRDGQEIYRIEVTVK